MNPDQSPNGSNKRPISDSPKEAAASKLKFHYRSKKKNPARLIRTKAAYMFFSTEMREKFKQDNTVGVSNQTMKKLSELWSALGEAEKAKYYDMAKADKERYARDKAELLLNNPGELIGNRTKKTHVKKPCSAYSIFIRERKVEIKKKNDKILMADVMKQVRDEWKVLTKEQRAIYQEKAADDKREKLAQLQDNLSKRSNEKPNTFSPADEEKITKTRKKKLKKDKNENENDSEIKLELTEPYLREAAPFVNIESTLVRADSKPDVSLNWSSSSIINSVNTLLQSIGLNKDNEDMLNPKVEAELKVEDDSLPAPIVKKGSDFHFGSLTKYSQHSSIHFLDVISKEFTQNPDAFHMNLDLAQHKILSASDFLAGTKRQKDKKNRRPDLTGVYQSTILSNPP